MKILFAPLIVACVQAEKKFKWDVNNLENVFCERSEKEFEKNYELTRSGSHQFLKARPKWNFWPWEYADNFEGECIEENCDSAEILEFCSRKDGNLRDSKLNEELLKQRMQKYANCEIHVEKRVNTTKQINHKTVHAQELDEDDSWRKELSPDRLFRGWWEELRKAYKRFCLQDETDCARKCNVEHGTCNLWEDKYSLTNGTSTWKYRCECDPGYGPSYVSDENRNQASQYLCADEIKQSNRDACGALSDASGKITSRVLTDTIRRTNRRKRKKRVAGRYAAIADNYFFPATVGIFHSDTDLTKKPVSSFYAKSNSRKRQGHGKNEGHLCGGTLVQLNSINNMLETDRVVTAAHCFCGFSGELDDNYQPNPNYFFIRVGVLDLKQGFNLIHAEDNIITPDDGDKHIDVFVKDIKLNNPNYLRNLCQQGSRNGEDDLAVLQLDGLLNLKKLTHVKPACNYGKEFTEESIAKNKDLLVGNENCFVSGWGLTVGANNQLGISNHLKYAKVEILPAVDCKKLLDADIYLQDMTMDEYGHWPIICASGFHDDEGSSNTCGGDSGGGLYCFHDDGNYYFMGALHGGHDHCQGDSIMYFNNNRHSSYQKLLTFH